MNSREKLEPQPFERYPALASWIERLCAATTNLSLGEWMTFVGALNNALVKAESTRPASPGVAGEDYHEAGMKAALRLAADYMSPGDVPPIMTRAVFVGDIIREYLRVAALSQPQAKQDHIPDVGKMVAKQDQGVALDADQIARAVCAERCGAYGEPACWQLPDVEWDGGKCGGNQGHDCDCESITKAILALPVLQGAQIRGGEPSFTASADVVGTADDGWRTPLRCTLACMDDMADWIERTKPQGVLYSACLPALREGAQAIREGERYAALGRACESHALGWYEGDEMRFQPPADVITDAAREEGASCERSAREAAEAVNAQLVEALTVIANASQRSETMFGGKMSEVTRVFENITRVARAVLTTCQKKDGLRWAQ